MVTGTWTTSEARERAAFVLGVAPDAAGDEAGRSYRRQLRLFAGDDEHARAARRTLMAAWAVWNETVPDLRLVDEGDRCADEVDVLDLARAEREARLAAEVDALDRARAERERRLGAAEAATSRERADTGSAVVEAVEVVEVVRDDATHHGGTSLAPRASRPSGSVIGVVRPIVGGVGFVVDDARAHRAYGDGAVARRDAGISVRL